MAHQNLGCDACKSECLGWPMRTARAAEDKTSPWGHMEGEKAGLLSCLGQFLTLPNDHSHSTSPFKDRLQMRESFFGSDANIHCKCKPLR